MICKYCETKIEYSRESSAPIWTARCKCVSVQHEWIERAERMCLAEAYKKNRDNAAVSNADMEQIAGNDKMGA